MVDTKMTLTLYWASGSPYAWRVMLALELKQIPHEATLLEFSKGDLKTPEFLALNPRGQVPVIVDGEYVLYESLAILAYLDRKYPEPPLFGRTAEEAGLVQRLIAEYQCYLDPAVEGFILPLYGGRADAERAQVEASANVIAAELPRFEVLLGERRWLGGDAVSAADLVVYPALASIDRAASKPAARAFDLTFHPVFERFPALAAWRKRMQALPGYERTYPPHWR